jgi:hypothetical protein
MLKNARQKGRKWAPRPYRAQHPYTVVVAIHRAIGQTKFQAKRFNSASTPFLARPLYEKPAIFRACRSVKNGWRPNFGYTGLLSGQSGLWRNQRARKEKATELRSRPSGCAERRGAGRPKPVHFAPSELRRIPKGARRNSPENKTKLGWEKKIRFQNIHILKSFAFILGLL